jgi:hypothetical protein
LNTLLFDEVEGKNVHHKIILFIDEIHKVVENLGTTDALRAFSKKLWDDENHSVGVIGTAPVVLLYLSPGFADADVRIARTIEGQEHYLRQRMGKQGLEDDFNPAAARWRKARLRWLGEPIVNERVAIANIDAYHSKAFTDHHILAALPSSQAMLDWAQAVLFPQAERGERMVVCMRAANFWGLEAGRRYGKSLFSPHTTRGGHMKRGRLREEVERQAKCYLIGCDQNSHSRIAR